MWVVHRRGGKDKTMLNYTAKEMFKRVGAYYYLFPTYEQGRKVLWEGIDKDGFRFLDHIPQNLRKRTDNQQMIIETINGSVFRVVGTDKIEGLRGTNPVGCVFSEFAFHNPMAWDILRPILKENNGWAAFVYTPYGENHGWELYEMARQNPDWFCELLTIENTGIFTKEDIDKERQEGMDEDLIAQEYYCSFKAALKGAYYANQIREAEEKGRFASVPFEERLPVHTFWDLGVGDATAIWFMQQTGREFRFIDYYENQGEGLAHYLKTLQDKEYIYGEHFAPHDIAVREFSTGLSRLQLARDLGINFTIVPQHKLEDGIQAVRSVFRQCWFDKDKCRQGINALKSYTKKYNEVMKCYSDTPEHNWAAHGSDAFRYFAMSSGRLPEYKTISGGPRQINLEEDKEESKPIKRRFR